MTRSVTFYMLLCCAFVARADSEDRLDRGATRADFTPDFAEIPNAAPAIIKPLPKGFSPIAPSASQPTGALSGRIVFMNSGHGWTWDPNYWRLQRGTLNEMNEDYGNLDQLNFFAAYCFNAGATVVSMRPLGQQTNEVVLDNDDPGVTFAGTWFDSTSSVFFGTAGDVPYRYANLAASETATATYTPNIPVPGFYPVYTWVRAGIDRGHQLHRIRHTGGESQVRIPHHMVGNGWIYLGEYYFNAGSNSAVGSVVVSNLRGSTNGTYTFADAIRFGNGMGSVNRGTGVSTYPREEENCRYWIQANLGQGQSTSLYDGANADENDSWSAPPKMSAEMNREEEGNIYKRIHISFHSNAGGGRGTLALITGTPTPNQSTLAQLCGREVTDDLVALGSPPLETNWQNRATVTYSGGYSEIDGSLFNYEMDATILEVAFHDSAADALLMRDPKARAAVGKASMHAVVRYMNQFDGAPLAFLPEPPTNVRALGAADGSIRLNWSAPVSSGGSGAPTGYVIYRSTNGYGFGNPVGVGNALTHTLTGLTAGVDYYFRISALNAGGESMPSEVVGCRTPTTNAAPRVLIVNGFDRYDHTLNLRQNTSRQAWAPPSANGTIERVLPRRANSFDYVVPHGKATSAFGLPFDSCKSTAVTNGDVTLGDYRVVVWMAGQESTVNESFGSLEQAAIAAFQDAGGHLFVSGSEIGWDLDRGAGPTAADRAFFNTHLHADFPADSYDNSQSYTVVPTAAGIFAGRNNATFDDGSRGIYAVGYPDVLVPYDAGASAALNYVGGTTGAAAIQYDGSAGGGKVVYLGFPFETITSATLRNQYMADALTFFTLDVKTFVPVGAIWKFRDTGEDLGTAWRGTSFGDNAWSSGPAQLGFGDGDEATLLNSNRQRITTYFRRSFNVPLASAVNSLTLRVKRDDGAVIYLNGTEIFRDNMPPGAIGAGTLATNTVNGAGENAWLVTSVSPALLVSGSNFLAVEIHQPNTNSSDLSFDLELTGTLRAPDAVTFIAAGASWRYRDNGVDQGTAWRATAFNDASWSNGLARLGFGNDGEVTKLAQTNANGSTNMTFYFRRQFYVPEPAAVQWLAAGLVRDDGAVVYLNGNEVWRDNMPGGAISFTTPALATIGGAGETTWLRNNLNASALMSGWNCIAVEIHQVTNTSSDVGFDFELTGGAFNSAAPSLSSSSSSGVTTLSWRASSGIYSLFTTTNLMPPIAWTRATNEPSMVNGAWRVSVTPATDEQRFFRLQSQ